MHHPSRRAVPTLRGVEGYYSLLNVTVSIPSIAKTFDGRNLPAVTREHQHQTLVMVY